MTSHVGNGNIQLSPRWHRRYNGSPERFSAAHFSPILDMGVSSEQAINMPGWCGVCGWLNRLKIALGEPH